MNRNFIGGFQMSIALWIAIGAVILCAFYILLPAIKKIINELQFI
jgi:hypothetical protein